MKVAMITPWFGPTGGPELTTAQLADALVEKGIDITLFAPADFKTKAKLVPTLEKSLLSMDDLPEMTTHEKRNLAISSQVRILVEQDDYDIIHFQPQRYAYAVLKYIRKPSVITLHNQMKPRDYALLKSTGVATIALAKKYQERVGADAAIYPGISIESIIPSYTQGSGLITIGRITDQKGIHLAIEIARKAGKKLTIVGNIGKSGERQDYYEEKIKPFIDSDSVRLIETIPNGELIKLIAKSEALLFPIIRPETFGRVSAEALACGTPVIGTTIDPLPELLTDPKVCFLSNDMDALAEAARNTDQFDRKTCRRYAEEKFDIRETAEKHILLYEKVIREYEQR